MVITVFSAQYSVFRGFISAAQLRRPLMGSLKQVCILLAFLNTEYWILSTAKARDLGIHGVIYPINEEDPIQLIQQKLKGMDDSGELKRRNLALQKKAKASVERPQPVKGVTKATKSHIFTYDPTYVIQEELYDHQGRTFAKKGTRINPLETISLSQNLLFFDGDDEEQLLWVKEQQNTGIKPLRLILVKGTPLKLSEEFNVPVYFDQGSILTKKLGIKHVPALVSQKNLLLKIEEIRLEGEKS